MVMLVVLEVVEVLRSAKPEIDKGCPHTWRGNDDFCEAMLVWVTSQLSEAEANFGVFLLFLRAQI